MNENIQKNEEIGQFVIDIEKVMNRIDILRDFKNILLKIAEVKIDCVLFCRKISISRYRVELFCALRYTF